MTEPFTSVDAHAYVDDCMSQDERGDYEAKLREDVDLRRRVDLWLTQNDAIRAAYRAPPRVLGPLSLGRPSNENLLPPAPPQHDPRRAGISEPVREAPRRHVKNSPTESRRGVPAATRAHPKLASSLRMGLIVLLSLSGILLTLGVAGGPSDARGPLIDAGLAAIRAFGAESAVPLDFTTADSRALAKQLSPRFVLPATSASFNVEGWTLIGVRMVPGTVSAAAFILWENRDHARAALMIEPLDAPAASTPRTRDFGGVAISAWTRDGAGMAAVGPDMKTVQALIRMAGAERAVTISLR